MGTYQSPQLAATMEVRVGGYDLPGGLGPTLSRNMARSSPDASTIKMIKVRCR
jgi:hypothetical protein